MSADRQSRDRRRVAVALAVVVAAGLLSRRFPLPGLFAEYTGDALYATAACLLFATCCPRLRTGTLAVAGFAFAAAVEVSQLASWPWLGAVRSTRLGALLLGQGFQFADLAAYAAGAALAVALDVTFLRRSTPGGCRPDRIPHHSNGPRT